MREPVVITSGDLTAQIDPLGAELVSLTDASGAEWLTDADPAFWTGHAPLLFPIVGRLNGDVLRVNGREYPMKQHGFARRLLWEVADVAADEVTFILCDNEETRAVYPFAFKIRMNFCVWQRQISMRASVFNTGNTWLPASFGFHPAFAWPLPGGGSKSEHSIVFRDEQPQDIRRLDAQGLLDGYEATPVIGRTLPLDRALFAADALVWDAPTGTRLEYRSASGPKLQIFHDLPMLGIWQKPGANFICIEPWSGHADPADFNGEFSAKPGIVNIPPGGRCSFRMDVTVYPS